MARIRSYDDLTPSIPEVSSEDVFASVERLLPDSGPVARGGASNVRPSGAGLFACVRSARLPEIIVQVARDFSPRIQRYGADAVVLDVSGLERLLGPPGLIGAELARAAATSSQLSASSFQLPVAGSSNTSPSLSRYVSRYGLRVEAHPSEHGRVCSDEPLTRGSAFAKATADRSALADATADKSNPGIPPLDAARDHAEPSPQRTGRPAGRAPNPDQTLALQRAGIRVAVAPTPLSALLLTLAGPPVTIVTANEAAALAQLPLQVLQQFMAGIHGVTLLRKKSRAAGTPAARQSAWPAWAACDQAFDVLQRWGLKTLGEFAALPAPALSARIGQAGVALQQLALGIDPRPLVPDPDVPRFVERLELEWPIDGLEPLSFVLARLIDPLSAALARADRAAAAVRLDLRLVDRTTHARVLQLPVALRDPRVLRTLLLLDLESHPPSAAIDIVAVEIDPAPGRVLQYSLLDRAMPSAETLATLTARLGALVGDSRCGTAVLLDTHRPDAFEMRRFDGPAAGARAGTHTAVRTTGDAAVAPCIRRFRPPVAVRVTVARGRPAHVAIERRGMPGGHVVQAAGPWRSSGGWWLPDAPWNRDEWDVELSDGSVCRVYRDRDSGVWFMEGVLD